MTVVRRLQAVIQTDGVGEFTSKMASARGSLTAFDKAVIGTGGALAALGAGGFAVAINEARKFETAMVELEKVTDPQTAREMGDAIMEMAETIPVAQQGLADIAADAGRFGVRGTENIRLFTEAVAKMAAATDLTTTEAGESLAKLATLTETPIPKVSNLGSAINELSNNFATSSSEIVDSMLRSAGAMSQFGLSQTEIAGFSAALNAVSESSERAGTRLRRLVQEINEPKKIASVAFALGLTVDQFKAMAANNPAGVLIGLAEKMKEGGSAADVLNANLSTTSRQALAALGQNLDGINTALDMSASAFRENTSLQREFEAASKTLDSQLKLLLNRIRNNAIALGNKLLPHVTNLVRGLNRAVDGAGALNAKFDGMVTPAALASTAIVGVVTALWRLQSAIGAAKIAAFASTLGLIGVAIVGLTGVIVGLYMAWKNNWFGIRDVTQSVVSSLTTFFTTLTAEFDRTIGFLDDEFAAVLTSIQAVVRNGLAFLTAIWNGDTQLIKQSWTLFWQSMRQLAANGIELVRDVFVWGITDLIEAAAAAFDWFPTQWAMMFSDLLNAAVSGLAAIGLQLLGFKEESRDMWQTTLAAWENAVTLYWPKVKQDIINGLNGLKQALIAAGQRLVTIWTGIWGLFPQPIRDAVTRVTGVLTGLITKVRSILTQIAAVFTQKTNQVSSTTTSTFTQIKTTITTALSAIRTFIAPFVSWLTQQWTTVTTTTTSTFTQVKTAVTGAVSGLVTTVRSTLAGIVAAFTQRWNAIRTTTTSTFTRIETTVTSAFNRIKAVIDAAVGFIQTNVIAPFLGWAEGQWNEHGTRIVAEAETTWNVIRTQISKVIGQIKAAIQPFVDWIVRTWNEFSRKIVAEAQKTWHVIRTEFTKAVAQIKATLQPFIAWAQQAWNEFGREIVAEAQKAWEQISSQIRQTVDQIKAALQPFIDWAQRTWDAFMADLQRVAEQGFEGIKAGIDAALGAIETVLNGFISAVQFAWENWGDEMISVVTFAFDTIKGTVEFALDTIATIIIAFLKAARGDTDGALQEISGYFEDTYNGIKNFLDRWGGRFLSWIRDTFNAGKNAAVTAFNNMKRDVTNAVTAMLNDIKRAAQNWVSGFVQPFINAKDKVVGEFNKLKNKVIGNSIIPEMLADIKNAAQNWVSSFVKPFENAVDKALKEFEKLKDKTIGNSIIPEMLSDIMDEVGDEWRPAFEHEFEAAALGAEAAMREMPNEVALPSGRAGTRTRSETTNNYIEIDVTVPNGVDVDTASRTIADELKSQNFN